MEMKYEALGQSDLRVSELCLGTMTWGEQNTMKEAHRQLDLAWGAGVNFIDAAEMYPVPPRKETQGLTEEYLGSWLASRGNRDRIVLATKVCGSSTTGIGEYLRGGTRLNAAQIEQALDASLRRLRTDYVDLYQVHWPERSTNYFGRLGFEPSDDEGAIPIEETLGALAACVEAGKVRYLGISNETPWGVMEYLRLARELGLPRIVSIQNPYNLLNRAFEVGLAEMSCRDDLPLLAYSPLAFGTLSGKYLDGPWPEGARLTLFSRFSRYTSENGVRATRRYVELAQRHGIGPAQMALAYVNSRPFVGSTIIGATTVEQLQENLDSVSLALEDELLGEIEEIHAEISNPCP